MGAKRKFGHVSFKKKRSRRWRPDRCDRYAATLRVRILEARSLSPSVKASRKRAARSARLRNDAQARRDLTISRVGWPKRRRSKYTPHQGVRERRRRGGK